ncbi:hypothetical protein QJS04_geneDACA015709 [Acorus gramineus]|uniref:Uncharacterized protein n=1 Tax=Acorus gramineus TaxID=55184 RepID=A0AAV9AMP0_ACOGR|nr:hypothetical protein QJS04_geneDACA015709 [Acorus gramineus]
MDEELEELLLLDYNINACGPLPLDACRGGRANQKCCESINTAIKTKGCPCICKQLNIYKHPDLPSKCYTINLCPMCKGCSCS